MFLLKRINFASLCKLLTHSNPFKLIPFKIKKIEEINK